MRKGLVIFSLSFIIVVSISFTNKTIDAESLRSMYSRSTGKWPKPFIDAGVEWTELGLLPGSPIEKEKDSLHNIIELGKILFFDTRLSGAGKISCATCHKPELSWTDGKEKSIGHNEAVNKRNSPTIQNVWFYKKLFYDGRASSLEDQAFSPINSETEMGHDMRSLPAVLRRIDSYKKLFAKAYGDDEISPDKIAQALAVFQRTIISAKTRFDDFLTGKKNALTNSELRGLHLFRTKAKCINCHNGPLFSDNAFHNNGFAGNDKGVYNVTHKEEDIGKLKTPSLRNVMKTAPWMHDGKQTGMMQLIEIYNQGKPQPNKDKILQPLGLTVKEKKDLLAFLQAISSDPVPFTAPVLPK